MSLPRSGAFFEGDTTRFTIRSDVATAVDLCLFDDVTERRVPMERIDGWFQTSVAAPPGTRYGFRVDGPWDPAAGHRCNPRKLLLDPHARMITGRLVDHPAILGHDPSRPDRPSPLDSAAHVPRSVVIDDVFEWGDDRPPRIPSADSIIYETHVRGISRLHPRVPPELQGTYLGLAHPAVVDHLVGLGVTAVELLPIHSSVTEPDLFRQGKTNYWGYNTIGFFSPHTGYAATPDPTAEFKTMVKTLHQAGLEVILDVVYNHTAEGDHRGPTLSFRGLDNRGWYRLDSEGRCLNWTGTGNTLDLGNPTVLRFVLDSLRYWVEEMHVDGFRFDLATALGRTHHDFDPKGGFFGAIAADPTFDHVKLIAEPWDLGPDGYQTGRFPPGWAEWNDSFRDVTRDFWKATPGSLSRLAAAITGSAHIYQPRPPASSINYVTSHDGFTLTDLVSYDQRRNQANGEGNHDGHHDNRSWNSGVEGPTTDSAIDALRNRRKGAFLATLLLAQGTPMILGGDELGRTQHGNNNAYNQDSPLSWYDWTGADRDLTDLVGELTRLRRAHPSLRRTAWLHEHAARGEDLVGWFDRAAEEMTPERWNDPHQDHVLLFLGGETIHSSAGLTGDDDLLIAINGSSDGLDFSIPRRLGPGWRVVFDSAGHPPTLTGDRFPVTGFSLVLLARG